MSSNLRWRITLVVGCIVLALLALAPTFFPQSLPGWWRQSFSPIRLGLDLQGGMHLLLGVDTQAAVESRLDSIADQTEARLRQQDTVFKRVRHQDDGRISVVVYDEQAGSKVDKLLADEFPQLEGTTHTTAEGYIRRDYRLPDKEISKLKDYAVQQALRTLRNRVDEFGVSEPVLQRQTGNRILVQLPGISNPQRAMKLLGKTARLEFRLVAQDANPQGQPAPGTEVLPYQSSEGQQSPAQQEQLAVKERTLLTGEHLEDARVRIDSRFNQPYVSLDFNSVGSKRFEQITASNVGRRLAIVLDGKIYSAPVIQERIGGGKAQISGQFSEQEATDLAIVLRAGSLPAPVKILENRTVGPSLGHDSIAQGVRSIIIGGILVLLLMVAYYRWSGLVANVALVLNLMFILALLSLFNATLTLPGIAGIVLTVGMAVDANVIIFERIREELRSGKTPKAALEAGYSKAFLTIIDANVTTLIAALVLFQFGTGPVKGFAVTLSIGILASLFTAIFVSRLVFDTIFTRRRVQRLSI